MKSCGALNALLRSSQPFEEEQAMELAEEVARLQAKILKSRVHSIFRVRNTLTSEQLALLFDGQ